MANVNSIQITLEVDDKGTVKVKQFADESKKAMDVTGEGARKSTSALESMQNGYIALTAKIAIATAAIYAVGKGISSFVSEAAEAEQVEKRLQFALEATGYQWQFAKSAVDSFANSIAKSTRFSDEDARRSLTDLMLYTQSFTKAQEGTRLAMDMSIRTGMDLGSASRLIGMALTGNIEMLGRYLPQLRNLEDRLGQDATMAQKAEYAMKVLNEKFSGTARSDLGTYSAKVAQFEKSWKELKETLGTAVLPSLADVLTKITAIVDKMNEWAGRKLPGKDFGVKEQLGRDLKEAEEKISIFEFGLKKAAEPGAKFPFSLSPEAKEKLQTDKMAWQDWANYLKSQIASVDEETKAKIKDIPDDLRSGFEKLHGMTEKEFQDRMSYSKLMYEAWVEETDQIRDEQERTKELAESWAIYYDEQQQNLDEVARIEAEEAAKRIQLEKEEQEKLAESWAIYYEEQQEAARVAAEQSYEALMRRTELMPQIKTEFGAITGNWDMMLTGQKEMLEVEKDRIIRENKLTGIYKEQVEQLYKMKEIDVEARRTMDVGKLVDIGGRKAVIDYNNQLADQYERLLPNSLNILEDAIRNTDGTWEGFLKSMSKGFQQLAGDIAFTILKMEALKALGYGSGAGGGLLGLFSGLFGGGGKPGTYGVPGYGGGYPVAEGANGLDFWTSRPTLILAGEANQRERVTVTPASQGRGDINIHVPIAIGARDGVPDGRIRSIAREEGEEAARRIIKRLS